LRLHPVIGSRLFNVEFCARYIVDAGEFGCRGPGAFNTKESRSNPLEPSANVMKPDPMAPAKILIFAKALMSIGSMVIPYAVVGTGTKF
jgi:hypothetical protein